MIFIRVGWIGFHRTEPYFDDGHYTTVRESFFVSIVISEKESLKKDVDERSKK